MTQMVSFFSWTICQLVVSYHKVLILGDVRNTVALVAIRFLVLIN